MKKLGQKNEREITQMRCDAQPRVPASVHQGWSKSELTERSPFGMPSTNPTLFSLNLDSRLCNYLLHSYVFVSFFPNNTTHKDHTATALCKLYVCYSFFFFYATLLPTKSNGKQYIYGSFQIGLTLSWAGPVCDLICSSFSLKKISWIFFVLFSSPALFLTN